MFNIEIEDEIWKWTGRISWIPKQICEKLSLEVTPLARSMHMGQNNILWVYSMARIMIKFI